DAKISRDADAGGGSVLDFSDHPSLIMINCSITGNSGAGVGGIAADFGVIMTGCTVAGNSTVWGYTGGVLAGKGTNLTNCTITGNSAPLGDSGGLYVGGQNIHVTNCTIIG